MRFRWIFDNLQFFKKTKAADEASGLDKQDSSKQDIHATRNFFSTGGNQSFSVTT